MKDHNTNSAIKNSDEEILSLFKSKKTENSGMTLLMNTHRQSLYHHIRRMTESHEDTDDILQNVFVKVYRAIGKFEGNSKLSTWLYRIATNETLTFLKKQKLKVVHEEQNQKYLNQIKVEDQMGGDEIIALLQKAIGILPEKQRLVFSMRYFDEMNYSEISDVLQVTTGGLKASFHHAVKKIEAYVKENQ